MRPATVIVRDERFLEHRTPPGHPERPERLETLYAMLDAPDMQGRFVSLTPRPAAEEELRWVHSEDYIRWVAATAGQPETRLSADTYVSAGSFEAARLAAGGVFASIAAVAAGDARNAFCLVRPPGHHAERSRAAGYCVFNHAALGVRFAQRSLGLRRVLVVDWDVHHGNGTQHAFERDSSVLFFSVHQERHYPGTGLYTDAGLGAGEGFSVNVPLPKGIGDGEYAGIFEMLLKPLAREFAPELVVVSAGFDAHTADPVGGMRMTARGFAGLARCTMDIADALCGGRLVLILEGGYHLPALRDSVKAVLLELAASEPCDLSVLTAAADPGKLKAILRRSTQVHGRFWKCFSPVELNRSEASAVPASASPAAERTKP
jgi:acetoin utilization deacetylase AcuC-like enzyme